MTRPEQTPITLLRAKYSKNAVIILTDVTDAEVKQIIELLQKAPVIKQ